MKTKLNRSNIQISGKIVINFPGREHNGLEINLEGLKQSKSGIYEIKNKFNNKRYIGMARDLIARRNHHWYDLNNGNHKSSEMQKDFEEFMVSIREDELDTAENCFEFNVILYCYPSQLTFYENLLITYLQPEYNTHKKKMPKLEKQFDENGDKLNLLNFMDSDEYIHLDLGNCKEEIM